MLSALIGLALLAGDGAVPPPPPPPEPPSRPWEAKWSAIEQEACTPKPPQQHIAYPEHLIGANVSGTAVLILVLNPCGEVRDAVFERSSRNRDIDRAARDSALTWVIDPNVAQLPPGRGGRVRVPVVLTPSAPEPELPAWLRCATSEGPCAN